MILSVKQFGFRASKITSDSLFSINKIIMYRPTLKCNKRNINAFQ